ncbi:MAG: lysophospholipase [Glaciecola sp.]|jgi:lysophospholipase
MQLTKETELPEKFDTLIKPWFENSMISGFWKLADGTSLHYRYAHHQEAISIIVISSGRAECAVKYAELIYDLYQNGHSVFIHDHRGQGLSSRLKENPHLGYIADFNQYVADFKSMIGDVLVPMLHQKYTKAKQHKSSSDSCILEPTYPPLHLLCHSMGSAIGALLVKSQPNLFSKAVFCSPMFGITPPVPPWIATMLVRFGVVYNKLRGKKTSYFFGHTDYIPTAFYKNRLMSSQIRYEIFRKTYSQQTELQLGGATYEWLYASLIAMQEIREQASKISVPCLIVYSGADTVVAKEDIEQVINDIKHCESLLIPEALHELFFEKDKFRIPALTKILTYLSTPCCN